MTKNSNRKGLALGAVFSLVTSLFVGALPASANTDGQYVALTPAAGPVTNFNGVLNEDFEMISYLLPGVSNDQFASQKAIFEITKTAGAMEVLLSSTTVSQAILDAADPASASFVAGAQGYQNYVQASSSAAVTLSAAVSTSGTAFLNVRAYSASGIVSSSPAVTLNIKVWIENVATTNGRHDALEWFTTKTITLHNTNAVPATVTVGAPKVGDTVLTVSGTVSALNFQNLSGAFFLQVESTNNHLVSANAKTVSPAISGDVMAARAGVVSMSFAVSGSAGITAGTSVSAQLRYGVGASAADSGERLNALSSTVITGTKTAALSLAVVKGDNAKQTGQVAVVRANQTYTFRVGATSNSASVSGAALEASITSGVTLGVNTKEISVDGAAATTSWPAKIALTTGTDGFASFTLKTTGFVDGNDFTIKVVDGNVSRSLEVQVEGASSTLAADNSLVSTPAGAATPVTFSVEDQWEVASARTDLRVKITKGGTGFSYTDTVSYVAVTAGAASFTFTPTPATKTGSATVVAQLQEFQQSTNTYVDLGSTVTVTVNVTAIADAHSVSPVVSQSSTVSYFPDTVSWVVISGSVKNAGALVEASGAANLIFRESSAKPTTSSAKLELRADANGAYSFEVASLLAKSHTVSIKVGTAVTTSLVVVAAAKAADGAKISFDKSSINAGETSVITGTLTDANGNPVDTTNEASDAADLMVSWTGKGLPFNIGEIQTDEDGKFKVNVLALAGDAGTGTLTATYRPTGSSSSTKNITVAQTITIVVPAAPAAPEVNAVIGTFNGRWAVRVENAKGAVVAVKVGGNWFKYTSLNENYLFSRKSAVGRSVAVAVYVNGTLENVATITIK